MQVTVIIPVYNAFPFLDKSIQSALDQKQTREVLLIDDRSTDGSLKICKKWELKDSRVKLLVNEGTKGAGAARNVGLRHATCEYVAFLDADDYYLNGRFDEDLQLFTNLKEIEVIANPLIILTSDQKNAKGINLVYEHNQIIGYKPSYSIIDLSEFTKGNRFCITGLTLKRKLFDKIGNFDEHLKQCQDTDLIIRMIIDSRMISGNIAKPVVVYSRHNHNTTNLTTEVIYFRRNAAKKHFKLILKRKFALKIILKFLKDFVEYDYLWYFGKDNNFKRYWKLVLLPLFLYRIFSKNDPEYIRDRKFIY